MNNTDDPAVAGLITVGYLPNPTLMTGTYGHEMFNYSTDY